VPPRGVERANVSAEAAAYNADVAPRKPVLHTIATTTHGRYLVGEPAAAPMTGMIVGFHGYAQNAETMAADLESIPGASTWLRIAVQGLHRFYTKSGQVVANWMTTEDRDLAIADNIAYVKRVVEQVRATQAVGLGGGVPLVLLGFSQGTAMAFRAAVAMGSECSGIVALGGDVPPDVRARPDPLPPVLLGRGSQDEWYTHAKLAIDVARLRETATPLTLCEYEGGHAWTDAFRAEAGRFLRQLARTIPAVSS
jgi:predicted esterase